MALTWPPKDPEEVLDYEIDWAARLDGDTIQGSTFTLTTAAGAAMQSDSNTDTTTTLWLTGGTLGETVEVLNRITTAGGRTMDQSVRVKIKAK